MKFISEEKNVIVWDAERSKILCQFDNGIFCTDDKREIEILSKKYKSEVEEHGRKTEQGNTERQAVKKEQTTNYKEWTYEELKAEAKRLKVKGYSRMSKAGMIKALKELD